MGAISDAMGAPKYGFVLDTGVSGLLLVGLMLNWLFNPTARIFEQVDETEYREMQA